MSGQPLTGADSGAAGSDGRLVVRNKFSELERVGAWVSRFAREHGLAREHAHGLDLAVAEALTNIMSYAYRDHAQHDIFVEMRAQRGEISVQIEDDGVPFNPLELPVDAEARSLEEAQPGGRGIPLMRSFMSKLNYLRRDDRNVLTMALRCAAD